MINEEPILYRNNNSNEDCSFISDNVLDIITDNCLVLFIPLSGTRKGKYCICDRDHFFQTHCLIKV